MTPQQRSLRARIAAHARHKRHDAHDLTAKMRAALEQRFIDDVDPDRVLPESERVRRAEQARKEYYARLSYQGVKARQRKAADDAA